VLYDNLKSAVLERIGGAIRFNPVLLQLAAHYRFEPRPVAPARGNQKGRVERVIRFVRERFFAGRTFTGLADLNAQASEFCRGVALARDWPEDKRRNDYSVPHSYVRRELLVVADLDTVRVVDGTAVIAEHARCYSAGETIEAAAHVEALVAEKGGPRSSPTPPASSPSSIVSATTPRSSPSTPTPTATRRPATATPPARPLAAHAASLDPCHHGYPLAGARRRFSSVPLAGVSCR